MKKACLSLVIILMMAGFNYSIVDARDKEGRMGKRSGTSYSDKLRGTMGICRMLTSNADMEINDIKNGVTITITSKDEKEVARIKKRAEIIRLMNELNELQ